MSRFHALGAWLLMLAVALGAFGAHGLKARVSPEMLAVWETAARYHALHGLGLFAVGYLVDRGGGELARVAGLLILGGVTVFAGTLYGYALTGNMTLAMITPAGGLCMILGWLAAGVAMWRLRSTSVAPVA